MCEHPFLWIEKFVSDCQAQGNLLREDWDADWKKRCNAKTLFKDLQAIQKMKISLSQFKTEMIKEMKNAKSDDWRAIESRLLECVQTAQ